MILCCGPEDEQPQTVDTHAWEREDDDDESTVSSCFSNGDSSTIASVDPLDEEDPFLYQFQMTQSQERLQELRSILQSTSTGRRTRTSNRSRRSRDPMEDFNEEDSLVLTRNRRIPRRTPDWLKEEDLETDIEDDEEEHEVPLEITALMMPLSL